MRGSVPGHSLALVALVGWTVFDRARGALDRLRSGTAREPARVPSDRDAPPAHHLTARAATARDPRLLN